MSDPTHFATSAEDAELFRRFEQVMRQDPHADIAAAIAQQSRELSGDTGESIKAWADKNRDKLATIAAEVRDPR
jgi:hypothetical protein